MSEELGRPPEGGFHASVKTEDTFLADDLFHDVRRAFVGACFVLESQKQK